MIKIAAKLFAVAVLAAGLTSCAGYRVGSMLPPDIKSVYVPTFVNKTKEPLIEVETTGATIEEIQKDGSLLLAKENEADAILNVTLIDYRLDPVSFSHSNNQFTTAKEYRLTITASFVLRRRINDTVVSESPGVEGDSTFQLIGDLSSSKLTGLPTTAADLAHKIVEQLVESWQTEQPAPQQPAAK